MVLFALLGWAAVPSAAPTAANGVLYVAAGGSDSGRCSKPHPCRTFNRAYHVARPGQRVLVAVGRYPEQDLSFDASKTSTTDVVFRPAGTGRVYIDDLTVNAKHLEFRDMAMHVWYAGNPSHPNAADLTFRNLDTDTFFITGVTSSVRVIGGDVGPVANIVPEVKSCYDCSNPVRPRNLLFDHVYFHDLTRTGNSHAECLHIMTGDGVTVRRSRFRNCAIIDLSFNQYGAGPVSNIVVENNFFDDPVAGGHYALEISANMGKPIVNALIRNNSSLATMWVDDCCGLKNVQFVGNVGHRPQYHCYGGVVFLYNVWDQAKCSATDRRAALGFRNPATVDLHLVRGAVAINRGDPKSYPRIDIDGERRPKGRRPDAGADEAR